MKTSGKFNLFISPCLLGVKCRYDAKDKKNEIILNEFCNHFNILSFCPEDIAFQTPREPINQVLCKKQINIKTLNSNQNVTKILNQTSLQIINKIKKEQICGFILKSKSPTCGLEKIKLYDEKNNFINYDGVGIFAKLLKKHFTNHCFIDENKLENECQRKYFKMQIFALKEFYILLDKKVDITTLIYFHTSYKYFIFLISTNSYKKLGKIIANHEHLSFNEVLKNYENLFLKTICLNYKIQNAYNVFLHIFGYFKNYLNHDEKELILKQLLDFKNAKIPLSYITKLFYEKSKLFNQTYLINQKLLNQNQAINSSQKQ